LTLKPCGYASVRFLRARPAATDEKIKTQRGEMLEVFKASSEGPGWPNTEALGLPSTRPQGVKTYDSVRDTFSRNGIPDEQSKVYIDMLAASDRVTIVVTR
jgi:hypothetical protein